MLIMLFFHITLDVKSILQLLLCWEGRITTDVILGKYVLYVNDGLASLQVLKRLHLTLILLKKELELSKLQVMFFLYLLSIRCLDFGLERCWFFFRLCSIFLLLFRTYWKFSSSSICYWAAFASWTFTCGFLGCDWCLFFSKREGYITLIWAIITWRKNAYGRMHTEASYFWMCLMIRLHRWHQA